MQQTSAAGGVTGGRCGNQVAGAVCQTRILFCHAGFVEEILQNTEAPSHGHVVGNFVEGCVACEMLRLAVLESLNGTKVKVVSLYFVVLTVWRAPSKLYALPTVSNC